MEESLQDRLKKLEDVEGLVRNFMEGLLDSDEAMSWICDRLYPNGPPSALEDQ